VAVLAKYPGHCERCGDAIVDGRDYIDRVRHEGWIHVQCHNSEYAEGRARGRVRSEEKALYGAAFVEMLDMQQEQFDYDWGIE